MVSVSVFLRLKRHVTPCALVPCLWCLPHRIVWKVSCNYVKVLCDPSDPLWGEAVRLGRWKQEVGSLAAAAPRFSEGGLGWGLKAGLSFPSPDRRRHMQTPFPSGRRAQPADVHRAFVPSVTGIHSSCSSGRRQTEGASSQFHLQTALPPVGVLFWNSQSRGSRIAQFLNCFKNSYIGYLKTIKSRNRVVALGLGTSCHAGCRGGEQLVWPNGWNVHGGGRSQGVGGGFTPWGCCFLGSRWGWQNFQREEGQPQLGKAVFLSKWPFIKCLIFLL